MIRLRIGAFLQQELSGKATDTWWDITCDRDIEKIGVQLQSCVAKSVLPFFDSMSDFHALHSFIDDMEGWLKQYPLTQIYFALLKNELGDHDSARALLTELVEGANIAWSKRAKKVLESIHTYRTPKDCSDEIEQES